MYRFECLPVNNNNNNVDDDDINENIVQTFYKSKVHLRDDKMKEPKKK